MQCPFFVYVAEATSLVAASVAQAMASWPFFWKGCWQNRRLCRRRSLGDSSSKHPAGAASIFCWFQLAAIRRGEHSFHRPESALGKQLGDPDIFSDVYGFAAVALAYCMPLFFGHTAEGRVKTDIVDEAVESISATAC